jgi:hypothetical protein
MVAGREISGFGAPGKLKIHNAKRKTFSLNDL